MTRIFSLVLFVASCLAWTPTEAQMLQLQTGRSETAPIEARVGDVLEIEVWANLDSIATSGMVFHLSLPEGIFEVIDNGRPGQIGVQPFFPGSLFEGAMIGSNALSSFPSSVFEDRQGLEYAVVFGAQKPRSVTGSGIVASFKLACRQPLVHGEIAIEDDPVRETRMVLPDGTTERRFLSRKGLKVMIMDAPSSTRRESWGTVKMSAPFKKGPK